MKATVKAVGAVALADPVQAWTKDISGSGLYLEFDEPLQVGTHLQLTVLLPPAMSKGAVAINCLSRVVRVVREAPGRIGLGAVIEAFDFVRGSAPAV